MCTRGERTRESFCCVLSLAMVCTPETGVVPEFTLTEFNLTLIVDSRLARSQGPKRATRSLDQAGEGGPRLLRTQEYAGVILESIGFIGPFFSKVFSKAAVGRPCGVGDNVGNTRVWFRPGNRGAN